MGVWSPRVNARIASIYEPRGPRWVSREEREGRWKHGGAAGGRAISRFSSLSETTVSHSTRASLIEVDDIRPVCRDFLHSTY